MTIVSKLWPSSAKRRADGEKVTEPIFSWMNVFSGDIYPHRFKSDDELAEFVRDREYCCVGQSHSYNGIQVFSELDAALLADSSLGDCDYDAATKTITCGPSATIRAAKLALRDKGRKMFNSGNHMDQTLIGALVTGTHGYGARATMADSVAALTFLDGQGRQVELKRGDDDFAYAALSFGTIGPIISVTLETAEPKSFQSDAWITRLSKKRILERGSVATSWAVVPYSDPDDPLIMLHTLREIRAEKGPQRHAPKAFTMAGIANFIIERFWAFDRFFPKLRRPLHRFADWINIRSHRRTVTDPEDLDYLYDPDPLMKSQRPPNILTGLFSTTNTAYNLAFHVPLDQAEAVVKFIQLEIDKWRSLHFHLKSLIGVRELSDKSDLPFAANFEGPAAAIDLFADVRDYAWLERIQREVLSYFPAVRPHWGKSAIVGELASNLGEDTHMASLRQLHQRHYPSGNLKPNEQVRKLFDLGKPAASAAIARATDSELSN